MNSLFHYQTLEVTLEKNTRSLHLKISENAQFINLEFLFEVESILSWVSSRVEVHSIVITSHHSLLSRGINQDKLREMSDSQIKKVYEKIRKINYSLMHLPQTVICDLGEGAQGLGAELFMTADIKLASVTGKIYFDHSTYGLVPAAGSISFLPFLVGSGLSRNWLLSASQIPAQRLLECGYLFSIYDSTSREQVIQETLANIRGQAPVQRIQTKLGLLESHRDQFEESQKKEKEILQAALISEDWRRPNEEFMKAKSMSYSVKRTMSDENEDKSEHNNITPIR